MGVKPRHQPEQHRLDDGSTREHARGEDACGNQQEYQNPEHRHAFASFHDTPPTSKPSSSGFDQQAGTAAQDVVLGIYYMTRERANARGEGMFFSDVEEVHRAYETGAVELHAKIRVRIREKIQGIPTAKLTTTTKAPK